MLSIKDKPSNQTLSEQALTIAKQAQVAARELAKLKPSDKKQILINLSLSLEQSIPPIISANRKDIDNAMNKNYDQAFIDRLTLTPRSIKTMAEGVRQIANLPEIIGSIDDVKVLDNGVKIGKMRGPLGVVLMIYESRPNVTIDAAALCLKTSNACILRGGSESIQSNTYLASLINMAIHGIKYKAAEELSKVVQVVQTTDRDMIKELVQLNKYIDVLIPRGGKRLIQSLRETSKIPQIDHLDGICHVYVDEHADIEKAVQIAFNSKCNRYGTCNTMETLLINKKIAWQFLNKLAPLYAKKNVELRCDDKSHKILSENDYPHLKNATEEDWDTEYLAPILTVKIVESNDEAIEHINQHSSKHTDSIISENHNNAMQFINQVDSSSVMINASTRLADGFVYGLGAEIGIATGKLHVRGPVGQEGLTNQKWVVFGDGQVRE